ncbi:MAG: tetratricopeptide repeat protein [Solirubrobacteraceae bacterium]
MGTRRPRKPRRRPQPALATTVGGQARIEKLVTVGATENLYLDAHAAPQALFQLPADIPDFVGRDGPVAELGAHLRGAGAQGHGAGARVALHGPPGVGKSALAIHLAHTLKGVYPDAQLYVNLGAGAGAPLAAADALAGFLRALGVEGPYPESEGQRAAFYRAQLERRRALVVLDDAHDLAQIRALLPGAPACAAIVTSRRPFGGLEGAVSLRVEVLAPDTAVELLGAIVGPPRVAAERAAAQSIACLCGELPLAVRIAGGRLKNNAHRTLAWLAERLEDERSRLGELESEDRAVRVSLTVSYEELAPPEARLLCLLAALPGPDCSTALAAGAGAAGVRETERLLDRLLEAQMLEVAGADRYRLHDLIRLFAGERLDAEPGLDRQAIASRAAAWLGERALAARLVFGTGDSRHAQALAWLEAERRSLVAAIEGRAAERDWGAVIAMTFALVDFFSLRSHWDDSTRTHELALLAAREAGKRQIEGEVLNSLAIVYCDRNRWEQAITRFTQALAIYRELGDRLGEGKALNNLANAYREQSHRDEAIANYEQALAIYRELGDRRGVGMALNNLANIYREQGRYDEAIANYEQDLAICRELGDRLGEGQTLNNLATVYSDLNRHGAAIATYERTLAIYRELGDRRREAHALVNLGLVTGRSGDVAAGERHLREAVEILEELGAPETERMRARLGMSGKPSGAPRSAAGHGGPAPTTPMAPVRRVDDLK